MMVHELNALKGFGVMAVESKFGIYPSIACVVTLNLSLNHLASELLERDNPHQRTPASVQDSRSVERCNTFIRPA